MNGILAVHDYCKFDKIILFVLKLLVVSFKSVMSGIILHLLTTFSAGVQCLYSSAYKRSLGHFRRREKSTYTAS
jgi:ABC-type uncharacterized transport system involved in gliding motility auxiliary subunit